MNDGFGLFFWIVILALICSFIAACLGDHGPSKWEILLQQCEQQNKLTVDYKACERKVLEAKKKEEDDDADNVALISSTMLLTTAATIQ